MGDKVVGVFMAIVAVAVVAVIVSKNSNTPNVVTAITGGFSQALGAAIAPITGATNGIGVSNPPGMYTA